MSNLKYNTNVSYSYSMQGSLLVMITASAPIQRGIYNKKQNSNLSVKQMALR